MTWLIQKSDKIPNNFTGIVAETWYSHWYKNGKRHRLDGPAIMHNNGYKEWWIEGKKISEKEFKRTQKLLHPSKIFVTLYLGRRK